MDAYRTPDERFAGLVGWPFEPRYVTQGGLRMHYVEEGGGDPLLLLHGEPTWGFLYRKLIPRLSDAGRVVVPDLAGFGRSDKPLRAADYSYDMHCRAIERFALELDLRRLTLVAHDWGGPIGLRFAVEHPGAGPAEIVEGAGHFLQEDKGEDVAERIVRFLGQTRV